MKIRIAGEVAAGDTDLPTGPHTTTHTIDGFHRLPESATSLKFWQKKDTHSNNCHHMLIRCETLDKQRWTRKEFSTAVQYPT